MVNRAFTNYERFLRIDPTGPTKEIVRARAVYGLGWGIIFIQLLNLVGMTATYGSWTLDHTIAVTVSVALIINIHLLRYHRNFMGQAVFFTALTIAGVAFSAIPDGTGINSALIPFIVMMPMLIAFIAGPRLALLTGGFSIVFVLFLFSVSSANPLPDLTYYADRNQQRALQAVFCLIIVSISGSVISMSVFRAFEQLEQEAIRAQKAEKAKSAFLAFMSHELRTPLNGILGLTDALERTNLDQAQTSLLKTINISGESLLSILNDILDLSKIDSEKLEINNEPFSPKELVDELGDIWRLTSAQKDLVIVIEKDIDVPDIVFGDDLRVRQILSNFLSNAVKFTDEGSVHVHIETIRNDEGLAFLQFSIADTGVGIPPEKLGKIFEPFEQADNKITRNYGGTGLGLTICQKLASLMDGDILLESTPSKGSVFSLRIPLILKNDEHQTVNNMPTFYNVDFTDLVVLVVEDNLINQMVMTNFLKTLGVTFQVVGNGQECIDNLYGANFDCIIMDKHMPVMDGVEAMKAIRALDDPIASVPIIACTADAGLGEREDLLRQGFTEFLTKPIKLECLKEVIEIAVARKLAA